MTDIQILQLWQKESASNKHIPFFLIKNYLGYIISIENKAMLIYKNISILKEDFASFRYIAAKKTLKIYCSKQWNHSLAQHFIRIYKSEIRDYCRQMTKKNHQILNYASSSSYHSFLNDPYNKPNHTMQDIESKDVMNKIVSGQNPLSILEKEIIYAKAEGYLLKEMAHNFSLSTTQISYIHAKAIKKLQSNYQYLFSNF